MAVVGRIVIAYDTVWEALREAAELHGKGKNCQIAFMVPLEDWPIIEAGLRKYKGREGLLRRIVECLSAEAR